MALALRLALKVASALAEVEAHALADKTGVAVVALSGEGVAPPLRVPCQSDELEVRGEALATIAEGVAQGELEDSAEGVGGCVAMPLPVRVTEAQLETVRVAAPRGDADTSGERELEPVARSEELPGGVRETEGEGVGEGVTPGEREAAKLRVAPTDAECVREMMLLGEDAAEAKEVSEARAPLGVAEDGAVAEAVARAGEDEALPEIEAQLDGERDKSALPVGDGVLAAVRVDVPPPVAVVEARMLRVGG